MVALEQIIGLIRTLHEINLSSFVSRRNTTVSFYVYSPTQKQSFTPVL